MKPQRTRSRWPVRSELSVPAVDLRKIEKALASPADVVFIDLEDSVAPSEKEVARRNVITALQELDWGAKPPAFRVNGLDSSFFYRDVIDVVEKAGDRLALIVVPKVARSEDLYVADALLRGIELRMGFEPGKIALEGQIESALGLINVERIAQSSSRLLALDFGPGDFSASVHMPGENIGSLSVWDQAYPGHRFHYPMSRIVVAARAAALHAIDGPVADFRDLEAFRRSCFLARALGFEGKWCIHPAQISIANEVFSPAKEEVDRARRIVDAYGKAKAAGRGVVSLDGSMVDAATIRMAEATLDLAAQIEQA
jgi:citrate lyase subunit beta/citryl-CoA lyase